MSESARWDSWEDGIGSVLDGLGRVGPNLLMLVALVLLFTGVVSLATGLGTALIALMLEIQVIRRIAVRAGGMSS